MESPEMKTFTTYKEIVLKLAAVYDYGDRLNKQNLDVMAKLLAQMSSSPEEAAQAAQKYIENAENVRFPIPIHKIMHSLRPPVTDRDQAIVLGSRIVDAISKFGWPNASRAEKYIGPVGWEVIRMRGGWARVCEESNQGNSGMLYAQMRDLAESVLRRSRAGMPDVSKMELPGSESGESPPSISKKVMGYISGFGKE